MGHPLGCARSALCAVLVALCACAAMSRSTEDRRAGAFVVLSRTLSGALVQGLNTTVRYAVHNVGAKPALRVALRDNAFPASRFLLVAGAFRHTWSSVKPGETDAIEVTVTPKRPGELFVSPPSVTYRDAGVDRISRLAAPDSLVVEDHVTYRRRTDSHATEWAAYAVSILALVAAPYAVSMVRTPSVPAPMASKKQ